MEKILKLPFVKFVLGISIVGLPYFGILIFGQDILKSFSLPIEQDRLYRTLLFLSLGFLVILLYRLYFKFIETKPMTEFLKQGAIKDIRNGILFTTLISITAIAILYFNNNISISRGSGLGYLPIAFAIAFMSSFAEEILFRGLLFRLTEESLGTYIAISISSILFGLAHYVNPGASILSALAIGLEAGLILSATYILTRKLWLNISIHFTWNLIGGILDFHYLDKKTDGGVLNSRLSGNKLLTGGEFGIEFSILIVAIGIVIGLYLISIAVKQRQIIKPFWRRTMNG